MDENANSELPLSSKNPTMDGSKKKKKSSSASEYYLKEENIQKMIEAAKSLRNRLVIRLLGLTGGRRFEVRNMRIQDINFENKQIWIDRGKGGDPKGTTPEQRRSRWVDIDDDELLNELKMYIGQRIKGKIIQSHNKKTDGIDLSGINRMVANTAELAGIKNPNPSLKKVKGDKMVERHVNPHLFRHSYGRRDMPLAAKQKLLGHMDARTTMQMYGGLTFEDARKYAKEARSKTEKATVDDPLRILKLKLANMEITPEEYEKRRKILEE